MQLINNLKKTTNDLVNYFSSKIKNIKLDNIFENWDIITKNLIKNSNEINVSINNSYYFDNKYLNKILGNDVKLIY